MNLANKLTMLRVALIPVYLTFLYRGDQYTALAVFVLASLTDFLDGYLARVRNMVTDFGKFMDPLADKLLTVAALAFFVEKQLMPSWCLLVVIAREFAVTGLRLVAVEQGRVIAAGWFGKIKTVTSMVCICLMHFPIPRGFCHFCISAIVATTVYSGIDYFMANRDVMRRASK